MAKNLSKIQANRLDIESITTEVVKSSEFTTKLDTKQNKLTAGTNVEITEDNVINVTGSGSYEEFTSDDINALWESL